MGILAPARLETLDFRKLLQRDQFELTKLLKACQQQGFFYLDPADLNSPRGFNDRLEAISVAQKWFDRPLEEKMKVHQDSVTKGYKPPGTSPGVVKNMKDGYESMKMPRDDFISGSRFLPEGLKADIELFRRDLEFSHYITTTILSCLSDLLSPTPRFEDHHCGTEASKSTMIYFRYLKQAAGKSNSGVGHNKHTDLGTLTLLYSPQGGLQVYDQASNKWKYVATQPGCYIVNVGDALRFLSGNQLLSAIHRVVPAPGYEMEHRYSSAYFLRPQNKATFQTSENTFVSALDWHDTKYRIFKASHEEQEKNTILTGGFDVQE